MASVRANALDWLFSHSRVQGEPTYTSKFYVPEKSWTGQSAWWLEIPRSVIENSQSNYLHLLCQVAPDSSKFNYLRVPAEFFRRNLSKLAVRDNGRVSLFLCAEPADLFVEKRGSGRLPFASFLVS
jgi:hypothetical protein